MKKYVARKYSATSFKIRMKCPHFFPSLDPHHPPSLSHKIPTKPINPQLHKDFLGLMYAQRP